MRRSAFAAGAVFVLAFAMTASAPHPASAQQPATQQPLYVYVVDLDIEPAAFDRFVAAAKTNAAASMHDAGCRAFDMAVSQTDPHHVLFFEVYDDEAALKAHEATDHFKQYQATTKAMVAKRQTRAFSSVAMFAKEK
jgi:quinol monooxygenase YgiN